VIKMVRAYLLIKVPAKHSGVVVEKLKNIDNIVEASAVYGETDVVAIVEAPDILTLDKIVMDVIQGIDEVDLTRTFIAIEKMHWQK
jgi:DNA-binding Lrp family transcriptional regulator